jgi:DNA-binding NtrC family response regulator
MDVELALVICKEGKNRERVALAATRCGLNPICCSNLRDARALLVQGGFRIVLCEDILPDGDFHMALREVNLASAYASLIVLTHDSTWEAYLKGLAAGGFDYIVCPASVYESERIVRCALQDTPYMATAARVAA